MISKKIKYILFIFAFVLSLKAQVNVSLPDTLLINEKSISIPIEVSNLTGYGIRSYRFRLKYDDNVLKFKSVSDNKTLSDRRSWDVDYYFDDEELVIRADGYFSLSGSGTLLYIKFDIIKENASTDLTFNSFIFNYGYPPVNLKNGSFSNISEVLIYFKKSGNGDGKISIDGVIYNLPFEKKLFSGKTYTLKSLPENSSIFNFWEGIFQSVQSQTEFTVTNSAEIILVFTLKTFAVSAQVNPADYGIVNGVGVYNFGDLVTVEANAYPGMEFSSWTVNGSEVSSDPNYQFNVYEDVEITANFIQSLFQINVNLNPPEAGQIIGAGYYYADQLATLEASSNDNWKFTCWTEFDDTVSTDSIYIFEVSTNRNLIANFDFVTNIQSNLTLNNFDANYIDSPYPNPFNPATNFIFGVTNTSQVSLLIYDITGEMVDKLFLNEILSKGTYQKSFNASKLPSGVYFYQFITVDLEKKEKYFKSGKLILLK
ncbi:MAG: T9SS type A sorting domain-containing protein [Ignavibacteriales bacterium]|nr:T9SS type A sorting domain-containing protein [Ignavibacteriales bacterium]